MKIKVIKVNVEILVVLKALEAQGMTLEDIKNADINEAKMLKSMGIDLSEIFADGNNVKCEVSLDLDKVLAIETKCSDIPSSDGLKGFTVFFNHKDYWILDESCFQDVMNAWRG